MNARTPRPLDRVQESEEYGLVRFIDIVVEQRRMIILITLSFVLLGALYAFLAPPVYQADIMVQVEDSPETSAGKNLLADVSAIFDVKSTAAAEAQILGSRLVVSRAVDAVHAYITAAPKRVPVIGRLIAQQASGLSVPGLFGWGGYTWGTEEIDVLLFDVPARSEDKNFTLTLLDEGRYTLSGPGLEAPVQGAVGQKEEFHGQNGAISLLVQSVTGRPGAAFVLKRRSRPMTIRDIQAGLNIQEKIKQSGVVIATLQGKDAAYLRDLMTQIGKEYVKQNVDRKSEDAAMSLRFLDAQLPVLKQQLQTSQQSLTKLRDQNGTFDLDEEARIILGQAADTRTRLIQFQQKKQEMSAHWGPDSKDVLAVDQQIGVLQKQADQLNEKLKVLPNLQQQLARAMLDVKVNTDLYSSLLTNAQQLLLVKAGKVGNVRLVDTPALPDEPVKPKKALVLAASLLFGLIAASVAAYARSILFGGFDSASQIEQSTGLRVYATIPSSKIQAAIARRARDRQSNVRVLALEAPHDPAVESLRGLRTALKFALFEASNKVVLVTGPVPGVGKSFVSANLAALLAAAGKRVLLIDCDIREGRLHRYFDGHCADGFTDLIMGAASFETAVRNVAPNLDLISKGSVQQNPSELLMDDRIPDIIKELSAGYDIVLMDSAPVLTVTDATVLAPAAGTVFIVAKAGVTKAGELKESIKRLSQNGVMPNGVLFNGVNPNLGRYGFGSIYGNYRYTAYTYEERPRLTK
ncbi:polysaccharide biosynthesis tyrosine autokinase [Paraburkholderia sp. JPY432]|uniref:polysaccharide biosynthesis tyrosine autokinase n=1 Tax=Paraburkholderia youngii TaxID=2782701 RepID=UPI00159529D7|nr:polysaccharide biosynthesis tyrosine autokinase [Paraburkholderia youngii]NVH74243.1 polysaccharide biosynthesis tyrosine autokinase [Paraburkholderia youngii]